MGENESVTAANPLHPGEVIRDIIIDNQWTVTEVAARLGCGCVALSRLLNGKSGISPQMALALERIGWSNADFWMRMQAACVLAQARREAAGAEAAATAQDAEADIRPAS